MENHVLNFSFHAKYCQNTSVQTLKFKVRYYPSLEINYQYVILIVTTKQIIQIWLEKTRFFLLLLRLFKYLWKSMDNMFYWIYLGRNNIHLVKLKKKIPIFLVSLLPLYTGYLLGLEDAALVFKNFNYHYIYHSENVRVAGVTIIKKNPETQSNKGP